MGAVPVGAGNSRGLYDVRLALTDMANQLRACRSRDGLTLQQLANRCGVAASTIHKIESQQMVPTVSVLLKIARGLGCRPEELVRDRWNADESQRASRRNGANEPEDELPFYDPGVGAWRIDVGQGDRIDPITLDPGQRATLFVERGQGELGTHTRRVRMRPGDCIEIEGEQFSLSSEPANPIAVLLIVSPAGRVATVLGPPNSAARPNPRARSSPA
jgi:transcriptional regulator with XRE-family HTH domain